MHEKGNMADTGADGLRSARASRSRPADRASARLDPRLVRGVACTLAGGICWGFAGTCQKFFMDAYGVDPLWLVCVRQLAGCVLFFASAAALPAERTRLSAFARERAGGFAGAALLLAAALSSLVNSSSYVITIDLTNSATATVLQTLGLVLLMAWACLRERRRPRLSEAAGVACALAGTFLLATGGDPTRLSMPAEGLFWGVVCGVGYAFYSAVPARSLARWGSLIVNGCMMLVSGLVLAVVVRPWECAPSLDAAGVAWLVLIVVVGAFLAFALYLQGVADIGPLRASLLGTSEPISATVFSALWLGVSFAPAELAGFALVIATVFLAARAR